MYDVCAYAELILYMCRQIIHLNTSVHLYRYVDYYYISLAAHLSRNSRDHIGLCKSEDFLHLNALQNFKVPLNFFLLKFLLQNCFIYINTNVCGLMSLRSSVCEHCEVCPEQSVSRVCLWCLSHVYLTDYCRSLFNNMAWNQDAANIWTIPTKRCASIGGIIPTFSILCKPTSNFLLVHFSLLNGEEGLPHTSCNNIFA